MPQRVSYYQTSVDTAGGGTGNNLSVGAPQWNAKFNGQLVGLRIDYHASADAGTDVTISEPYGLKRTLLTRTNSATDTTFNPVFVASDSTGGALTAYTPYYVDSSNLQVAVADSGGELTAAVVVIVQILEDY